MNAYRVAPVLPPEPPITTEQARDLAEQRAREQRSGRAPTAPPFATLSPDARRALLVDLAHGFLDLAPSHPVHG